MLICVTHILECPEKIIPSFVWLARTKQRDDIFRDLFTRMPDVVDSGVQRGNKFLLGFIGAISDGNK